MRLRLTLFVFCLALPVLYAQQSQPPTPFIEPMEHRHGKRELKRPAAAPHTTGQWTTIAAQMPINPVHVALMHNGKVLVVSGSGNDPTNHNLEAGVWNPATQTITTFTLAYDMFCNGMVVLPDGRPFVIGGTVQYDPFFGEKRTSAFSPATATFTQKASMSNGRWYPTGTVLGNGTVLAVSGLGSTGSTNNSIDVYHPATNTWTHSGTAFGGIPLFPRDHLLPNGKIFESGANPNTQTYIVSSGTWTNVATTIFGQARDYGTSVLLPLLPARDHAPRVFIAGGGPGGANVTNTTEVIDLSAATPAWSAGPNMVAPRIQLNATILPGGRVLVSGGSSNDEDPATAVLAAELYDAETNTFSPAESMEFPRLYHSNTILLPDATVMAVGGNPMRGEYEPHVEIYSPPYLFKPDGTLAPRPAIGSKTTSTLSHGAYFDIYTRDAAYIKRVELIRAGAVTHAFDMDQRLVGLRFTAGTGTLHTSVPVNRNITPPGWYMLFIIDGNGVPSKAHWVHLT
ncbi:MAG TPA: galactose oxidase-like domain-containing protein [Thermoanaerobaculia bacterium]|nr:galactose oxidase-like domain-containing protein [Thermoanaerobaculia bacterium]